LLLFLAAQGRGRGVAVHLGHLAVHEHQVEGFSCERFERFASVFGQGHATAQTFQDGAGDDLIDLMIFDQKNAGIETRLVPPQRCLRSQRTDQYGLPALRRCSG
jgi:hypothetical protein